MRPRTTCRVCRRRPRHPTWTNPICTRCHNRRHRRAKTAWQGETEKGRRQSLRSAKRRPRHKKSIVGLLLTREEWLSLYRAQEGRCGICLARLRNKYEPDTTPDVRLHANVDHQHSRERELVAGGTPRDEAVRRSVRGMLCYFCNRNVLGVALRDDADKAERAATYLRWPPARAILGLDGPC